MRTNNTGAISGSSRAVSLPLTQPRITSKPGKTGSKFCPKASSACFAPTTQKTPIFTMCLRLRCAMNPSNADSMPFYNALNLLAAWPTEHFLILRRSIKRRKKYEPASSGHTAPSKASSGLLRLRLTIWYMRWISWPAPIIWPHRARLK